MGAGTGTIETVATKFARANRRDAAVYQNIVGEAHTIGEEVAGMVFPFEAPADDEPSSVAIAGFTEVDVVPQAGQFRVLYDLGTRLGGGIEFDTSDDTTAITIDYRGRGSVLFARDANMKADKAEAETIPGLWTFSGTPTRFQEVRSDKSAGRAFWGALSDTYVQVGPDGQARAGVMGGHQRDEASVTSLGVYFAYDAFWDGATDTWIAKTPTATNKWKIQMGREIDQCVVSRSASGDPISWVDLFSVRAAGVRLHAVPLQLPDGIAEPATVTGFALIYVDSADGDLKVKFSDGIVKTIVTDV